MGEKSLDDIVENLQRSFKDIDEDYAKMADECDPEIKLAVTKWVFKHLVEHAQEGGTYRYLIYDRLGFGTEAYVPLCSDGMTISNEFDLDLKDRIKEVVISEGYDKMKPMLGCCDEPGCYNYISCGWSSDDDGYRQTCGNHYFGK